jgi:hypothetical protein
MPFLLGIGDFLDGCLRFSPFGVASAPVLARSGSRFSQVATRTEHLNPGREVIFDDPFVDLRSFFNLASMVFSIIIDMVEFHDFRIVILTTSATTSITKKYDHPELPKTFGFVVPTCLARSKAFSRRISTGSTETGFHSFQLEFLRFDCTFFTSFPSLTPLTTTTTEAKGNPHCIGFFPRRIAFGQAFLASSTSGNRRLTTVAHTGRFLCNVSLSCPSQASRTRLFSRFRLTSACEAKPSGSLAVPLRPSLIVHDQFGSWSKLVECGSLMTALHLSGVMGRAGTVRQYRSGPLIVPERMAA